MDALTCIILETLDYSTVTNQLHKFMALYSMWIIIFYDRDGNGIRIISRMQDIPILYRLSSFCNYRDHTSSPSIRSVGTRNVGVDEVGRLMRCREVSVRKSLSPSLVSTRVYRSLSSKTEFNFFVLLAHIV